MPAINTTMKSPTDVVKSQQAWTTDFIDSGACTQKQIWNVTIIDHRLVSFGMGDFMGMSISGDSLSDETSLEAIV